MSKNKNKQLEQLMKIWRLMDTVHKHLGQSSRWLCFRYQLYCIWENSCAITADWNLLATHSMAYFILYCCYCCCCCCCFGGRLSPWWQLKFIEGVVVATGYHLLNTCANGIHWFVIIHTLLTNSSYIIPHPLTPKLYTRRKFKPFLQYYCRGL